MSGLFKINPLLSFILSVCLFSLAGIPPFIGFYAKINIFQASINSGFILISCFFMIISVISTFYYIRMVKLVFFENMYKK
jgi:NADH-quinone oxidoreductase subunit N